MDRVLDEYEEFFNNTNVKLLKKQIKHLLDSNIPEPSKEGLHNLLGAVLDKAMEIQGIKD